MAASLPLVQNQVAQAPTQDIMGAHHGRTLRSGFEIWDPSPSAPPAGQFDITGSEFSQILEIEVQPSQTVTCEPGTMLWMTDGMEMDADIGGLGQGCKRLCCAGESFFRLHLVNKSSSVQKLAITPRFPAKVLPVDLSRHSGMIVNRGAFLAAIGTDWRVNLQMVSGVGTCLCGGQGLFMNTLHGSGMAFLNGGGTVISKTLADGEELVVDHHSVLAFERTVQLGVRRAGGCMVCCCAGQGLFNAVLKGPGFVMVHSMGLGKLAAAVGSTAQKGGQANSGAQS